MIKWRPSRPGFNHGKVMVMITRWDTTDGREFWDAEVYPNNSEIVAEADTLQQLLIKLQRKTTVKDILSRVKG